VRPDREDDVLSLALRQLGGMELSLRATAVSSGFNVGTRGRAMLET
jgi:hypothetical protein